MTDMALTAISVVTRFRYNHYIRRKKLGIYSPSAMIDNKRIRDFPEWNIFYRMSESME